MRDACVYCGVYVSYQEHHANCPSVTNLWPVRKQDIEPHGFGCTRCDHLFEIGEFYVRLDIETDVCEAVCLSCAAAAMVAP